MSGVASGQRISTAHNQTQTCMQASGPSQTPGPSPAPPLSETPPEVLYSPTCMQSQSGHIPSPDREPHGRRPAASVSGFGRATGRASQAAVNPVHSLIMETMHLQSELGDGQLQLFSRQSDAVADCGGGGSGGAGGGGGGAVWQAAGGLGGARSEAGAPRPPLHRQSCSDDWRRDVGSCSGLHWQGSRRQSCSDTLRRSYADTPCPAPADTPRSYTVSRQIFHGAC